MMTQAHFTATGKPLAGHAVVATLATRAGVCAAFSSMAMKRSLRRVGNQPRLFSATYGMGSNPGNTMTRMFVRGAPRPA